MKTRYHPRHFLIKINTSQRREKERAERINNRQEENCGKRRERSKKRDRKWRREKSIHW